MVALLAALPAITFTVHVKQRAIREAGAISLQVSI